MDTISSTYHVLSQVKLFLQQVSTVHYTQPIDVFAGTTIGQHTRHILEFYQCLFEQCDRGTVNYDARQRNLKIEREPEYASKVVDEILECLNKQDLNAELQLQVSHDIEEDEYHIVNSNMERELIFNIEHAIHHKAIIKIGQRMIAPEIKLPEDFGVAPSTIKYQKKYVHGNISSNGKE